MSDPPSYHKDWSVIPKGYLTSRTLWCPLPLTWNTEYLIPGNEHIQVPGSRFALRHRELTIRVCCVELLFFLWCDCLKVTQHTHTWYMILARGTTILKISFKSSFLVGKEGVIWWTGKGKMERGGYSRGKGGCRWEGLQQDITTKEDAVWLFNTCYIYLYIKLSFRHSPHHCCVPK